MIRSMTGFGSASAEFGNKKISVELKSINSKFFDLTLRIPSGYREKEFELRTELSRMVERGKLDCSIAVDAAEANKKVSINTGLVKSYHAELSALGKELNAPETDYLPMILGLPDVLNSEKTELDEAE